MPELPEVEIVRMGLSRLAVGKTIISVEHDTPKSFPNAKGDVEQFMIGATIVDVRRRAKVLLVDLSTQYTLVIHLKMTGQLVFVRSEQASGRGSSSSGDSSVGSSDSRFGGGHPTSSLIDRLPDRSTRVTITFSDGSHLYFNDQRKFGWVRLMPTVEVENLDFFKKVGPEPLSADTTAQLFITRIRRRKGTSIKAALLDQTTIAGVGNIYADESLWGAKIHPTIRVGELTDADLELLFSELVYVLKLSIEKGGSTDKTYVNAEGKKGSYIKFARVFRREKLPCPRCGEIIIKTRVAGRGTHTCPQCQRASH